jgi:hypothetical protein
LRSTYLEPLTEGRVGALSGTADVGAQTRALFPTTPQAGSAPEVADTVRQLVRRDAKAATDLVAQHAKTVFAEATQANAGGANQFGGAKFASTIRGNSEQAASLEAAVKALPGGNTKWQGFSNFLDVLEATGQRLPVGSATAFNQQGQEALKGRGVTKAIAGLKTELMRRWDERSLTNNSGAVAELLANSSASGLFGRLAKENGMTPQAVSLSLKLVSIAGNNARVAEQSKR